MATDSTSDEKNIQRLIEDVERDLLFHIVWNMKHSKISMGQAQLLAKDFLTLLPFQDKKDLLEKLNKLGHSYPEAQAVFLKYASAHEEQRRQKILNLMTEHIKTGQIEQAIKAAKGEI